MNGSIHSAHTKNMPNTLADWLEYLEFVAGLWDIDAGTAEERALDLLGWLELMPHAHERMGLFCQNGMLQEIQLSLPKDLTACSKLSELLAMSAPFEGGRCGERIKIDVAGPQ